MKQRINKAFLASLPDAIRAHVQAWQARWHKSSVSVNQVPSVYIEEDGKFTAYNTVTGAAKSARAGGEWCGGLGDVNCNTTVPLPVGCVMVCERIFLGCPMLSIYVGTAQQNNAVALAAQGQEVLS